MLKKIISFVLSFSLITSQPIFAQGVAQINLGNYLRTVGSSMAMDKFRPLHMRYFSYDAVTDNFQLLLDKGDNKDIKEGELEEKTKVLMDYFKIGLALPNEKFWVNLRPDAQDQIIDPELEKTDMGKIMLEADLQLKKDTAGLTSPQNPQGKAYWDKLYKKAGELFGSENITIPTITRPWIVPGEIILRQGEDSAYIFKANMKVMLEQDHLKGSQVYDFKDPRMKELNEYSSQLIRELIIPRLTKEVNTSKRYAALRQVFFSLVMARWFKDTFSGKPGQYAKLIDSHNLNNLTSKEDWSKTYYFNEYKKSFEKGEYNLKEEISTPTGQVIRSYVSGGVSSAIMTMPPAGLYKGRKHLNAVNAGYKNGRVTIKEYPGGKESNSKKRSSSAISQERKKIIASQLNGYLSRKGLNRSLVKNFIKRSMNVIGVSSGSFDFRGEAISFDCMESLKADGVYLVRLSNEVGSEFATIYVRTDESISTVWRGEDLNLNYIDELTEKIISALSSQTSSSSIVDVIEEIAEMYRAEEIYDNQVVKKEVRERIKRDLGDELGGKIIQELEKPKLVIEMPGESDSSKTVRKGVITPKALVNRIVELYRSPWIYDNQGKLNPGIKNNIRRDIGDKLGAAVIVELEKPKLVIEFLDDADRSSSALTLLEKAKMANRKKLAHKLNGGGLTYEYLSNITGGNGNDLFLTKESFESDNITVHLAIQHGVMQEGINESYSIELINGSSREVLLRMVASKGGQVRIYGGNDFWNWEGWDGGNIEQLSNNIRSVLANGVINMGRSSSAIMPGGIDFRQMNYLVQPMGSFKELKFGLPILTSSALERINLEEELKKLRDMVKNGMVPSGMRVKEYLAACFQKGKIEEKQDDLLVCLAEIYRLAEEENLETSPELRESLVIVDTGKFVLLPNNQKVGLN